MRTFELTQEHVTLLGGAYIDYDDSEPYWGSVGLNVKRPFGNKCIAEDMCELLGIDLMETDDGEMVLPAGTTERMKPLYEQLATALQVILMTGSFEPGTYESDDYRRTWERISS